MPFFDVYGPYDVQRENGQILPGQGALWEAADGPENGHTYGLSTAIGCYIFGIQRGGAITPWYVGMTTAQNGFRQEVFTPHKLNIYNDCVRDHQGAPKLFLFPLYTNTDRFSHARTTGRDTILWLERTLMTMAFSANPDIKNVQNMNYLRRVEVLGILGPRPLGRPHNDVASARNLLGLD